MSSPASNDQGAPIPVRTGMLFVPAITALPITDPTLAITVARPGTGQVHARSIADYTVERTYSVKAGDTLSGIAQHFYGRADAWTVIYWANHRKIRNPNLIFPGWRIHIPAMPARIPAAPAVQSSRVQHQVPARTMSLSGTLSYGQLEALWDDAGGAHWAAPTAACIAEHESGGRVNATGAAGERGLWQIMPSHGSLSTYDPAGNARGAVIISNDGTDWGPWTTAPSCGV